MASFTDAISQFNPYVQQLPVELMGKVGMQKQAQYDAGVQKIQQQVDNVAGIEVARPIDKEYLQSKIGDLGNRLKTFAAADFSNQQLVNTVGGMTSQITKDDQILNAVASTANIKRQDDIIKKAYEKGEWAPENQDLYDTQKLSYLSSTDKESSFVNGKYIPYTNVFKTLKDVAATVGLDEKDIPSLFATDSQGNPLPEYVKDSKTGKVLLDKTGKPIPSGEYKINPVMKMTTIKGKPVEKLLSAFKNALGPKEYQQLAITGRYMYKNIDTPEEISKLVDDSYSNSFSKLDSNIEAIRAELMIEENLVSPDKDKVQKLAEMYQNLNDTKDSLLENVEKIKSEAITDKGKADAIKGKVYTDSYLSGIANSMTESTYKEKVDVNPYWTIWDKNRDFALKQVSEQNTQNYRAAQLANEREKIGLDKLNLQFKYGLDENGNPKFLPTDVNLEDPVIVDALVNQYDNQRVTAAQTANDAAMNLSVALFKGWKGYANMDDAQIKQEIAKTLKQKNMPLTEGETNKQLIYWANKYLTQYGKDQNKIPLETKLLADAYSRSIKDLGYATSQSQEIDKLVEAKAKEEGVDYSAIKDVEKLAKPTTLQIRNQYGGSETISLSKQDVLDIATAIAPSQRFLGGIFSNKIQDNQSDAAKSKLLSKFGPKAESIISSLVISNPDIGTSGITHRAIAPVVNKINEMNYQNINKIKAQVLKDNVYLPLGVRKPLVMDSDNKATITSNLSSVINRYKNIIPDADLVLKDVVDGKFEANLLVNPSGLGGANTYLVEVATSSGGTKTFPVDESIYSFLTNTEPPRNMGVPLFIRQIDLKGTSNALGHQDASAGNLFNDSDFKNFKSSKYGLTGDFVPQTGTNNLIFKIYAHDKKTGETTPLTYDHPIPRYDPRTGAINPDLQNLSLGINNDVFEQLLNKSNKK